jgi:hypothetical protein
MKVQKPAEGILKTGDFGSYKSYHVECECGSSECAHKVTIEADDMEVSVYFYLTLRTKWYSISRWKQIWIILTKGYLDTESTLILNEQAALNYANALKSAVKDVKELRNESIERRKQEKIS